MKSPNDILDSESQIAEESPNDIAFPVTEPEYAGLTERVKALFADSVILVIAMMVVSSVFSSMKDVSENSRIIAFVCIFFVYDPFFTAFFSGTIGHRLNGLRVRRESDQSKRIMFHLAVIRYAVKAALGLFSILTVTSNEKNKAIHDMIAGSVVIRTQKV